MEQSGVPFDAKTFLGKMMRKQDCPGKKDVAYGLTHDQYKAAKFQLKISRAVLRGSCTTS
jgi:hypothetical protein